MSADFLLPDYTRKGEIMKSLSMKLPAHVLAKLEGQASRLGCYTPALARHLVIQGLEKFADSSD